MALVEAADSLGGRLPELFSGLDRSEAPWVVSYPASCIPQARSAASPLVFLRTLLRLDPWVPHGKLWAAPALPPGMASLRVRGIPLAGRRITVEADRGGSTVEGLPPDIELVGRPRYPQSAV